MRVNEGVATVVLSVLVVAPLSSQAALGWMQVATTGPAPGSVIAMSFDSWRGRTVALEFLFSNTNTWEWTGSNWANAALSGPTGRSQAAMVFDSQRGRTVLFGGIGFGNFFGDTWEWDGASMWTQVSTTGPSSRCAHAMAYDSQRGRTVLFGGGLSSGIAGDTWEWDGSNWTPTATTGPSPRYGHAMAYDSQRGRTVLFGGQDSVGTLLADTWEWDGAAWLPQTLASGPSARAHHAMVYDSGHGRTVLFGGWRSGSALGDTWEWDGIAWTVAGNTGPATRFGHAMAFDSGRERTILFGGNGNSGVFGDTWERIGVGTAFAYGAGCGTPALTLDPVASAPPTINTTAQLLLSNIGSSFTYVALGWSRTAYGPLTLPLSLAGFGMPGCDLLTSSEFTSLPVTLNGVSAATLSLPLPNMPPLIGLRCYLQGWCFAPGANPGQLIVSNGVEWDIGL